MSTTTTAGGPAVTVPPPAVAWQHRLMARHDRLVAREVRMHWLAIARILAGTDPEERAA